MIERLAELGQMMSTLRKLMGEEAYQKHMETVKKMIAIYDEWEEMWRMLEAEDPNACVALAEELEHIRGTVHYELDMDDLYERVRD